MNNIKLLFSGNTAWSMYNFRKNVLESFINKGVDVVVVAPNDNIYSKKLVSIGCKFISININRKGTNPINDYILFHNYKKILKEEKPNGCFFYTIKPNIYGGMAAGNLKIPFIAVTTGLGYIFNNNSIVSKIAKTLYKISFSKATQVWFLNNEDVKSFTDNHLISENKSMVLKGEGIDTKKFTISNSDSKTFSFILIARILWDKGVGFYVEAAKALKSKYPDIEFKLLGTIDCNNPMGIPKKTILEWHNSKIINYLGEVEDVRPYIQQSSCVVLPSFYREGIPFCLMEGAASGKPIITTNNIGCKEVIIDGYNGFICKVKDKESLINAMEKMIKLPIEERNRMGKNGRILMENEFDVRLIIKKYHETIDLFRNIQ